MPSLVWTIADAGSWQTPAWGLLMLLLPAIPSALIAVVWWLLTRLVRQADDARAAAEKAARERHHEVVGAIDKVTDRVEAHREETRREITAIREEAATSRRELGERVAHVEGAVAAGLQGRREGAD